MLFIYAITGCVIALWTYEALATGKFVFKRTFFDKFILLFVGTQALATVFSIDKATSFYGYYGRFNGGLLSTLAYVVLFYALISHIDRFAEDVNATVHKLLKFTLVSSALVIAWGISGRTGHDLTCLLFTGAFNNACWTAQFNPAVRMFSTLGQPNWLGAYLGVTFFIGLYYFITEKSKLYSVFLIANFVSILFTRSRSALIAVVTGLGVYSGLYFWAKKDKQERKIFSILLICCLVALVVFKTGFAQVDKFLPKFEVAKTGIVKPPADVTESFDIRKIVWSGAYKLGMKNPILGTGPETFAYSYYFTRPMTHNNTSEWDFIYNRAHNEFLNFFATSGFIGLGAYLLLIGSVYYYFLTYLLKRKKHDDHFYFVSSILLAYSTIHVTNFFGFSTTTISLFFFLLPALLYSYLQPKKEVAAFEYEPARMKKAKNVSILVFILGGVFVVSYFLADTNYAMGDNYVKIQEYDKARMYLERAASLRRESLYQDKLSSVYSNLAFLQSFDNKKDDADMKKLIALSEENSNKAIAASPYNAVYWKTRAKNLFLFYQLTLDVRYFDLSDKALDAAQVLAPTDPKILYTRAIFYLSRFDNDEGKDKKTAQNMLTDKGMKSINRAIEMKRDYRDAYYVRGLILKKLGKTSEAQAVFQFMLNTFGKNDEEVQRELKSF